MTTIRKIAYKPSKKVRRRRRLRMKVFIPFVISVCLMGYLLFNLYGMFFAKKPAIPEYVICDFNAKKTKEVLSSPNVTDGEYEIQDYLFYAESLGLFSKPYDKQVADPIINESITFRNLCNNEEYVYLIERAVDKQIPLYELTPGYYEVFVSSLMKDERVYMGEKTTDIFYTITRNNTNNKITLIADKKMYYEQDEEFQLEKPYLYVEVKQDTLPADYYDIILDPGHHSYDYGKPLVENGHSANGLLEATETMKVAAVVKAELEAAGLKVLMSRNGDNIVDTYGIGGRMELVYKHHAKYYVSMHLNSLDDKRVSGSEVYYSSFASPDMAKTILKALVENSDLSPSGNRANNATIPSVIPSSQTKAENHPDGKIFDSYIMIREAGGKALDAGEISEASRTQNKPFIEGTNYGAGSVMIEFLYISNTADASKWLTNYETYGKAAALGIKEHLQLQLQSTQ